MDRETYIYGHVSRRLKGARAEAGLSQAALASRLHVTQVAISSWETGSRHPGLLELDTLAKALQKPVAYFLDWLP